MFFSFLSTFVWLIDTRSQFKLEFRVAPSVLGLVIGKEGKNVERVAKMPGVESVRVQRESFSVLILAKVYARVCGSQCVLGRHSVFVLCNVRGSGTRRFLNFRVFVDKY